MDHQNTYSECLSGRPNAPTFFRTCKVETLLHGKVQIYSLQELNNPRHGLPIAVDERPWKLGVEVALHRPQHFVRGCGVLEMENVGCGLSTHLSIAEIDDRSAESPGLADAGRRITDDESRICWKQ